MFMFSLMMIFSGLVSLMFNRKFFLNSLLSLEFISLGFFFLMFIVFLWKGVSFFYLLFFLTMAVCEGCLGLSLLVVMSYYCSNDMLKNINTTLC